MVHIWLIYIYIYIYIYPAANSSNSHTSNLSKFVDHYLPAYVPRLPSYVKDNPDFTQKVRDIQATEDKLLSLVKDLSRKHPSIKFNFKY